MMKVFQISSMIQKNEKKETADVEKSAVFLILSFIFAAGKELCPTLLPHEKINCL